MTSPVFSISLPAAAALFIDFLDAEGIESGSARAYCAPRGVRGACGRCGDAEGSGGGSLERRAPVYEARVGEC